jgi:hypothetical protein
LSRLRARGNGEADGRTLLPLTAWPVHARQHSLQQVVRLGKQRLDQVRRALIIIASASNTPVPANAQLVAAHEDTVRDVIHRFNEIGLCALDLAERVVVSAESATTTRPTSSRWQDTTQEAGPPVHALQRPTPSAHPR